MRMVNDWKMVAIRCAFAGAGRWSAVRDVRGCSLRKGRSWRIRCAGRRIRMILVALLWSVLPIQVRNVFERNFLENA